MPPQSSFKWNQYGFTLGGPIQIPKLFNGRNRLFFMSNYEGFKLRNQTQTIYNTAPAAMRTGDFSQLLPGTVIKDPLNGQPFQGNIIPSGRLDKIAQGLLEFFPAPNIAGAGLVNNYLALDANTTDKDQFSQRIDFVENSKSCWFGRYSWPISATDGILSRKSSQNNENHVGHEVKETSADPEVVGGQFGDSEPDQTAGRRRRFPPPQRRFDIHKIVRTNQRRLVVSPSLQPKVEESTIPPSGSPGTGWPAPTPQ